MPHSVYLPICDVYLGLFFLLYSQPCFEEQRQASTIECVFSLGSVAGNHTIPNHKSHDSRFSFWKSSHGACRTLRHTSKGSRIPVSSTIYLVIFYYCFIIVSVCGSTVALSTMTKATRKRKGFTSVYNSSGHSPSSGEAGTQSRNSEADTTEGCCTLANSLAHSQTYTLLTHPVAQGLLLRDYVTRSGINHQSRQSRTGTVTEPPSLVNPGSLNLTVKPTSTIYPLSA